MEQVQDRSVEWLLGHVEALNGRPAFGTTQDFIMDSVDKRGPVLPHGVDVGGRIVGEFRFKPPTTGLRLALGRIRARPEMQQYPARRVVALLAESLESLVDESFSGLKVEEREQRVRNLDFRDIFYLVLYRGVERGEYDMPMRFNTARTCAKCQKEIFEINLDLGRTVIASLKIDPKNPPRAVVALTEPLTFGSLTATKLILGPPSWGRALWSMSEESLRNTDAVDFAIARAAIIGSQDGEGGAWASIPEQFLMNMPERDLDALIEASRPIGGNLNAQVPFECPHCGAFHALQLGLGDLDLGF